MYYTGKGFLYGGAQEPRDCQNLLGFDLCLVIKWDYSLCERTASIFESKGVMKVRQGQYMAETFVNR